MDIPSIDDPIGLLNIQIGYGTTSLVEFEQFLLSGIVVFKQYASSNVEKYVGQGSCVVVI